MLDPSLLCRQHLLGEYSEIAKHRHNFVKRHRITGRLVPVVTIEPANMQTRFYELKAEGLRRGYNMRADYTLPDLSHLTDEERGARVDLDRSRRDLSERCAECRARLNTKLSDPKGSL